MTPDSTEEATSLRTWLDAAHERHPQAPQDVADGLLRRAAQLPADEEGAEAVRLAEHVMLAHLADVAALQAFLAALPAAEALQPARDRAAWALSALGQAPAPRDAVPQASQWRAWQNVLLLRVAQGHGAEAAARLRAEAPRALVHAEAEARQAFAACANNLAQELRLALDHEQPAPRAERVALMLEAAALARQAWAVAGTWLHVERAEYQLALCHAVAGQGEAAVRHAQACLAICEAEGADATERFFAHEAAVHAQVAAANAAAAAHHRERMQTLLGDIADEGLQAWCRQTLEALPRL